jgi:hypothetical protein
MCICCTNIIKFYKMQGTCMKSENTVYFITELSMAALMHTKPQVAGHPVTAGVLQSLIKKALSIISRNGGGTGAAALGSRVKGAAK